jgi:hypothetical protein
MGMYLTISQIFAFLSVLLQLWYHLLCGEFPTGNSPIRIFLLYTTVLFLINEALGSEDCIRSPARSWGLAHSLAPSEHLISIALID